MDIQFNKKFSGKWYVIRGDGPMLLEREWIREISSMHLNIDNKVESHLFNILQSNIEENIVNTFPDVFTNKLGLYNGEEIELAVIMSQAKVFSIKNSTTCAKVKSRK